ncbi:NTP/NDP exchange transporter, partial [Acidobacteriota bacterium]
SKGLKGIFDIRRKELSFSLLMFGYFFLVITTFWVMKPIKKSLFIGHYNQTGLDLGSWHLIASQAELIAKVANMLVAIIAVMVFSWLAKSFRREQLTYTFSVFFMACFILYSYLVSHPADATVWTFYLFGDLWATLMVATFFAFLNDSVTPERAKRLYGLIGLGGVMGGAFGSTVVRVWIKRMPMDGWMWVTLCLGGVIVILAMFAGKWVRRNPPEIVPAPVKEPEVRKGPNPAIAGAKLVFASRYLLAIVGIVGLYEIVSTVMDFQFTATIEHFVAKDDLGQHFSTIFMITNIVAMFVQLFLTSYIMTRFGLKTALFILPAVILFASVGYMALPILWIGSLLNTADNGFSYSINQSAKEALYVPTTREEKYKAKAFIDMFVQRFAKALAVGVSLAITTIFTDFSTVRWLSVFILIVVVVWFFAARYAGKKFDEISKKQ